MKEIRTLNWNGTTYEITVSDDHRALLASYEAGGAVVGLLNHHSEGQSLYPAEFVVERVEDIDDLFLKRVVQRRLKLPWDITTTRRLSIREFSSKDPLESEEVKGVMRGIFTDWEKRDAYIKNQYGFFGYGIWALVEKESGNIIGKAGISEDFLGYHIHQEHRRKGYAKEASQGIIQYARKELFMEKVRVSIQGDNEASLRLAFSLGFSVTGKRHTKEDGVVIDMERSTDLC